MVCYYLSDRWKIDHLPDFNMNESGGGGGSSVVFVN